MKKNSPSKIRFLWWAMGLLAAGGSGLIVWGATPAKAMPEVFSMVGGLPANRTDDSWLTFVPDGGPPVKGLILYPGGRVDYRAYAPLAQSIADHGYLVTIVRMPLNLAVLAPDAADDVISAYPNIRSWAIGGHSLGGVMAANYVYTHPGEINGLVFWASYPTNGNDLSNYQGKVVSISASLDGLSTPDKIEASRQLLPPGTTYLSIEGGNHAQFGWYGEQSGDNSATITREAQQAAIVQATVDLLVSMKDIDG